MAQVCILVLETLQREEVPCQGSIPASIAAGHLSHLHDFAVRHLVTMAEDLRRKHEDQIAA